MSASGKGFNSEDQISLVHSENFGTHAEKKQKKIVSVSDDITTVRLHFSSHIDTYNSSSLNVRQALAEILCHNLAQVSGWLTLFYLILFHYSNHV